MVCIIHHWVTTTLYSSRSSDCCGIHPIWQVEVFHRSSKPWRCGLQITTNQFLHTPLHFLLGHWALFSPVVLSTVKKADKNFSKQMQLPGTSLDWVYSQKISLQIFQGLPLWFGLRCWVTSHLPSSNWWSQKKLS